MPNFFGAGGLLGAGLKAGQLLHRMTVIGTIVVDLPNGGQEEVEGEVESNVPCTITPLDASEKVQLGAQFGEATHQIRAHYTATIKPEHRIRFTDSAQVVRELNLLAVINVMERGRELNMLAVERVS